MCALLTLMLKVRLPLQLGSLGAFLSSLVEFHQLKGRIAVGLRLHHRLLLAAKTKVLM